MEPKQFSNFAIYSKAKAEFRCGANRKVSLQGGPKAMGQEPRSRRGLCRGAIPSSVQVKRKNQKDKKCHSHGKLRPEKARLSS